MNTAHEGHRHEATKAARAACRKAQAARVQHIIANREIGMTECGLMVDYHEATDATPWAMGQSFDVAIWDNDLYLSGYRHCDACKLAYEEEN